MRKGWLPEVADTQGGRQTFCTAFAGVAGINSEYLAGMRVGIFRFSCGNLVKRQHPVKMQQIYAVSIHGDNLFAISYC